MKTSINRLFAIVAFLIAAGIASSPASAEEVTVTSGDVLEICFDVPDLPSPDSDIFYIFADGSTVTGYFTAITEMFDGDTPLGTYTGGWSQITSRWVTADSPWDIEDPQVIDFTSLLNGTIRGRTRMTISDNSITFDTGAVRGQFGTSISYNEWYQGVDVRILSVTVNPGVNMPPVADAGPDQKVVVGDAIQLTGSATDPDNDSIVSWFWTIESAPVGSVPSLDDPSSQTPMFTADLVGEYVLSLVVNDGVADSGPATVTITAVTIQEAAVDELITSMDTIDGLDPDVFANRTLSTALTNKIDAAIELIDQGLYEEAHGKLQRDILRKTDGCAASGSPDKNDWIRDYDAQEVLYPLVLEAIELLEGLL